MLSVLLSRFIVLFGGTLYPAYRSYKAIRTKNIKEYTKWMMYWICYAIFTVTESVADTIIAFWFPFYYEIKILFIFWLINPWTKGAQLLYRKWLHPYLTEHEEEIDAILERAKAETYNQVIGIGTRGLNYARDIVASAAMRSQISLAEQIQRSLSVNDVSRISNDLPKRVENIAIYPNLEEQEELNFDIKDKQEVRTWAGYYDENNQIVEQEVHHHIKQTVTQFGSEDVVVVEDPHESRPKRTRRQTRSRSRTTTLNGIDEADQYNTLPRTRKTRKATTKVSHDEDEE